ncbi:hypothetical protein OAP83_00940 [Rickettsiales bacterium]|nr:hypothetical protein [Rickettsiales bacterium]
MLILHRANNPDEQKFKDSRDKNVGFEIDIRDCNGQIVIAHDLIQDTKDVITLAKFFEIYNDRQCKNLIAINIKSCGLAKSLKNLLVQFNITNYFVFDMAVPDILDYIKEEVRFFTRQSEYETLPSFYEKADGVWLDEFKGHWITEKAIMTHIEGDKKVAIVSPELHGRGYKDAWKEYKKIIQHNQLNDNDLMICTDFPEEF